LIDEQYFIRDSYSTSPVYLGGSGDICFMCWLAEGRRVDRICSERNLHVTMGIDW
jgi:hypothetical protein